MPRFLGAVAAMALVVAVLWAVQLVDVALHGSLLRFGIVPRDAAKLPDILSSPFLHASWTHLESNTPPLFVLGVLVAWRGLERLLVVSAVAALVGGLGVWLVSPSGTDTVGASGVIFGYLGFLVAAGLVERRLADIAVAVGVGIAYWWTLPSLLPGDPAVSWQDHVFGLAGGILAAVLLHRVRSRRAARALTPAAPLPGVAGAAAAGAAHTGAAGAAYTGGAGAGAAGRRADLFTLADVASPRHAPPAGSSSEPGTSPR